MKKVTYLLALVAGVWLLSGCQGTQTKTPSQTQLIQEMNQRAAQSDTLTLPPDDANSENLSGYLFALQQAIREHIPDWEKYRGDVCTLRMSLNRQAKLTGLKVEGERSEFCAVMYDAVLRTNFPPFPSERTYQNLKNAALDFKP
ncbi:cell envelope integrity TolA C-terminal domain-containing protein [Klebsiella oxytoca]